MAYDPQFELHIAEALLAQGAETETVKMFGGVAFMVNGNMSVGITNKGDFMVRFDGSRHEEISGWPGAKPITFGKGDTKGFLFVDAEAVEDPKVLRKWVALSLGHILTLPKKASKAKKMKAGKGPAKRK